MNEELDRIARDHWWPLGRPVGALVDDPIPRMVSGNGCWVTDEDGREFLDAMSGNFVVNIGYGRSEVADAVHAQMSRLCFASQGWVADAPLRLVERLARNAPDPASRVYLTSGGSEAVETALKIARKYHKNRGESGRWITLARRGSYHGGTLSAGGLGARPGDVADFGPYPDGAVQVTQPDRRSCSSCRSRTACTLDCADDVERALERVGPHRVAAVVVEPISSCTIDVPHPDYAPRLREICDRHGVLLIYDEVITGLGRTGKMWAANHWNVVPDILVAAKGVGSGYVPVGATVVAARVASAFDGGPDSGLRHLFTQSGNPAVAAGALVVQDIVEREGLVAHAEQMGRRLMAGLRERCTSPRVADVRGLGLMCALDIDLKATGLASVAEVQAQMVRATRERGLLVAQAGLMTQLMPPLVISEDEVDRIVESMGAAVDSLQDS